MDKIIILGIIGLFVLIFFIFALAIIIRDKLSQNSPHCEPQTKKNGHNTVNDIF